MTARAAFTPGPWTVKKFPTGTETWIEARAALAGRGIAGAELIAEVRNASDANARLIAAAPALYEALTELREAIKAGRDAKRFDDACANADAALALGTRGAMFVDRRRHHDAASGAARA